MPKDNQIMIDYLHQICSCGHRVMDHNHDDMVNLKSTPCEVDGCTCKQVEL
jgi:hypothetical protein